MRRLRRSLPPLALLLALAPRLAAVEEPKAAAAAGEPAVLKPGDPAVTGSFMKPCTNTFSVVQTKPGGTPQRIGTWNDEIKVEELNGRAVIRRTQNATTGKVTSKYVNVVDQKTMAPVWSERTNSRGLFEHTEFDGAHVKYRHAATPTGGPVEEKDLRLAMPVFEFGGMFGMLVDAFPLREGYSFKFPNLDVTQPDDIEWLTFTVKGKEMVAAGAGKKVEAWIVESRPAPNAVLRLSLTKEPPYVIRLEQMRDGVTLLFEMI